MDDRQILVEIDVHHMDVAEAGDIHPTQIDKRLDVAPAHVPPDEFAYFQLATGWPRITMLRQECDSSDLEYDPVRKPGHVPVEVVRVLPLPRMEPFIVCPAIVVAPHKVGVGLLS